MTYGTVDNWYYSYYNLYFSVICNAYIGTANYQIMKRNELKCIQNK